MSPLTTFRRSLHPLFLVGAIALAMAPRLFAAEPPPAAIERLQVIERSVEGRLGVAVLDTGTGEAWGYRADERFPLCSTFKTLACAAVLQKVDAGKEKLDRRIRFEPSELVSWSPVTEKRAGGNGMRLLKLCEATMTQSDNTAANLILKTLDGPEGLTAFVRTLGDEQTRLDRWETDLGECKPGDPRDTTTPTAVVADVQKLALGDVLSEKSRAQLVEWLLANQTGNDTIRAGVPTGWKVGDKTGAGGFGTRNDVGIIWPPKGAPIVLAVYLTETEVPFAERNAVIADVTRVIVQALGR
ncbi:MAG: class A beta-lactamase [Verrucomicrobiota bacterium JB022]|nr:class A beta-lactamase [Verrucomicrobiota bacterium JB022]